MMQVAELMMLAVAAAALLPQPLSVATIAGAQEISPVFVVFHALDYSNAGAEPVWSPRAKITVDSLTHTSALMEENSLSPEDELKLEKVLAGGRYQLKVVDTATGHHVIGWTPHKDPLSQSIKISLDPSGFLEGVAFLPTTQSTSEVDLSAAEATGGERAASVQVDVMQVAPAPETATYIQRLEVERREKEKSQGQDNRSFLAKYWIYIVPVVIFFLISGASNPEGQ